MALPMANFVAHVRVLLNGVAVCVRSGAHSNLFGRSNGGAERVAYCRRRTTLSFSARVQLL